MTELMLTGFGTTLGRTSERFQVRRREQPHTEFAAEDVSHILISGKGMSLSADALAFAVEQGIPITLLSFSGNPYARLATTRELDNALLRREQLYATTDPRGAAIACALIHGKLRNQAATLRYFAKSRKTADPETWQILCDAAKRIFSLARDLKIQENGDMEQKRTEIMALEAQAARYYWQAVAALVPDDLHFNGRKKKGAADPLNTAINYGYGILYSRLWNTVARTRLDPYTGFLHTLQEGKPALIFDLVEPFRSWIVDRPLIASVLKKWRPQFDEEHLLAQDTRKVIAARILERFNQRFRYHKKMTRANDIILAQVREVAAFLQQEAPLKSFIAPW
ncbi:MAG: CRISPR-associated endonuclease Cas1 [Candidatus Hydrogenedentes bacterium]|nr:CRISPR-associated endonuclease Cas1 [Candidatus Hydrogenedentota bacterium]